MTSGEVNNADSPSLYIREKVNILSSKLVCEAGKTDKHEDVSESDKRPNCDAFFSEAAGPVGCSRSAGSVKKWTKEGTAGNQRHGHEQPRLIDARVKACLCGLIQQRANVAQSSCRITQHHSSVQSSQGAHADLCPPPKPPTTDR